MSTSRSTFQPCLPTITRLTSRPCSQSCSNAIRVCIWPLRGSMVPTIKKVGLADTTPSTEDASAGSPLVGTDPAKSAALCDHPILNGRNLLPPNMPSQSRSSSATVRLTHITPSDSAIARSHRACRRGTESGKSFGFNTGSRSCTRKYTRRPFRRNSLK